MRQPALLVRMLARQPPTQTGDAMSARAVEEVWAPRLRDRSDYADGADVATEYACRFSKDRAPYPAINLAACGSLITATGNDYGFEEVFARGVRAFGGAGDVFVGITTSGNSPNIIAALRAARELGVQTIALLGRDGGAARGLADVELIVPGTATARIQEAHKFLLHVICETVDERWLLKK